MKLNEHALQVLANAGVTPAEWARANWHPTDEWTGDQCGCPDDRCANGFHHLGVNDCGCLPALLEVWLDGSDPAGFATAPLPSLERAARYIRMAADEIENGGRT